MVFNQSVVIKVFELIEYLEDIMAWLEEDQYEDSKSGSCFALIMVRRKKKRQKSKIKHAELSKASTDAHVLAHHLLNCFELPCSYDCSLSLIAPLELSEGRWYKVSRK